MHNKKQKQGVLIYTLIIKILWDIEVMIIGSMHDTAVKTLA